MPVDLQRGPGTCSEQLRQSREPSGSTSELDLSKTFTFTPTHLFGWKEKKTYGRGLQHLFPVTPHPCRLR